MANVVDKQSERGYLRMAETDGLVLVSDGFGYGPAAGVGDAHLFAWGPSEPIARLE